MVMYGNDNRHEALDYPDGISVGVLNAMKSVGVLVQRQESERISNGLKKNDHPTGVAGTVKFTDQTCLGFATAFLVSPSNIVSAGHAVWKDQPLLAPNIDFRNVDDIKKIRFILDWQMEWNNGTLQEPQSISPSQIYEIDRIRYMTPTGGNPITSLPGKPDFLIMSLTRSVADRDPLKFATQRPLPSSEAWIAGHPLGMPKKFSSGLMHEYPDTPIHPVNAMGPTFRVYNDLCTYAGNSGSPIFDVNNQVVGIHVVGYNPAFTVVAGLVIPTILPTPLTELTKYAKAMRTDGLRWLFNTNASILVSIEFRATIGPPSNIEIWHSLVQGNPGTKLGQFTHVSSDAQTQTFDCTQAFQGRIRPLDCRFWSFRIDSNVEPYATNREMGRMRVICANPADSVERIELWDSDSRSISPNHFTIGFVLRILQHPIWADGIWPQGWPAP